MIKWGWEEVEKGKVKETEDSLQGKEAEKDKDKRREEWPQGKEVEQWRMVLARYVNPF